MIDRRTFLIATASAAATAAAPAIAATPAHARRTIRLAAPFAAHAVAFGKRVNASLADGFNITIEGRETSAGSLAPRDEYDIVAGTLDTLSDIHPSFAYFAGLPGQLGMPDAERLRWMATGGARPWQDLQDETGFTCLVAGTTRHGADLWSSRPIKNTGDLTSLTLTCDGVAAKVLNGLGINARAGVTALYNRDSRPEILPSHPALSASFDAHQDRPYCARNGIAQHGRTLAIVMRRRAWERLSGQQRAALAFAAVGGQHLAFDQTSTWPQRHYQLPDHIANARDRVAEAVLADLSNHDTLTQRINGLYFAACRNLTI